MFSKMSMSKLSHVYLLISILGIMIGCYFYVDLWIANIVHAYPSLHHAYLLEALSLFGSWPVMLSAIIILYGIGRFLWRNTTFRRITSQIGITLIVSNLIVATAKITLGRARPPLWFDNDLYGFYGPTLLKNFWSFPSGHAVTVMSIVWSLCLLCSRYRFLWLFLGLLVISTRILLLRHYLSDVIASTYISMLVAIVIHQNREQWRAWV